MMATSCNVLLLMVSYAFLAGLVNGNFTMRTPLDPSDIICLEECQFYENNRTIAIINITSPREAVEGVAYYSTPIRMKDPATRTVASFSTSFMFKQEPMTYDLSTCSTEYRRGDGFTFAISNSNTWVGAPAGRLGMFRDTDQPKVVAVEFDNWPTKGIDYDLKEEGTNLKEEHVGLDIKRPISLSNCSSIVSHLGFTFWKRDVFHSWIEYDGIRRILQLRVANTSSRPVLPLLNCSYDLFDVLDEKMWIGFSGGHGNAWSVYYIYNWTFTSYGISDAFSSGKSNVNVGIIVGVSVGILLALLFVALGVFLFLRKKRAQGETWDNEGMVEMAGMPEFISYKHLSAATKQFSDQSKLGQGGFGSVYRGVLPKTGAHVAVKRVSNDSRQGEREFLAEVKIISQLRHRNVVELMGFCRDRGKFLLVYELLPNGSLDKALFKPKSPGDVLSWSQRWKIVSGTAAALHYLHEGWRQQVIHRDVKSSNIMLDGECNAKLGDFGLARLVDHQKDAATTLVAGTYGYIAPEAAGGKFTDKTDVFAFGAVALEVACGRKAFNVTADPPDDLILVDVVWRHLKEGKLLSVADARLQWNFDESQMEVVLLLGLLCSHPDPSSRPSMRQVVQVLAGDAPVPSVPVSQPPASLAADLPRISIDDLLSSKSGSQNSKSSGKRLVSSTSMPSSSSASAASSSRLVSGQSFITQLQPR